MLTSAGKGASKHNDLTRYTNNTIHKAPFSPRARFTRKGTREFETRTAGLAGMETAWAIRASGVGNSFLFPI